MKRKLENEFLRVHIDDMGAELVSIYDKENEREDLWQAEAPFWNRHAPVLFPNVGKHHNHVCRLKGKEYHTTQHGFARDMEFACIEEAEKSVTHKLCSNANTLEYLPYTFELFVTHRLEGRELQVEWQVSNKGGEIMYFTIGGHPGFQVPILSESSQTEYFLLFDKGPSLSYKLVYGDSGTADASRKYELKLEKYGDYYRCPITEHMFDLDALIFDDSQFEWAAIGYPDGTPYISMDCKGFTNFGIWTMPGGPYICLEPWMGRCDDYGFEGELSEKPDVIALDAGEDFNKAYTLTIHK